MLTRKREAFKNTNTVWTKRAPSIITIVDIIVVKFQDTQKYMLFIYMCIQIYIIIYIYAKMLAINNHHKLKLLKLGHK